MTEPLFVAEDDDVEAALLKLRGWKPYPFDDPKDRPMLQELHERFPTVDLPWTISKWVTYMEDQPKRRGKKVNWRVRIKTWVERESRYQRGGSARNRVSGAAESTEVHGRTSDRLDQW